MIRIRPLSAFLGILIYLMGSGLHAGEWTIIPDKTVGALTRNTSEQELIKRFGKAHVKHDLVANYDFERSMVPGTVLFPEDPTKTAYIVWKDTIDWKSPSVITILNKGTEWKTNSGITIGTSLDTVEKLNQKPVAMVSFGVDYGGTSVHGSGGRLKELGLPEKNGRIRGQTLILLFAVDLKNISDEQQGRLFHGGVVLSTDPKIKEMKRQVYVEEMVINWE
jgi:hypothetical protein